MTASRADAIPENGTTTPEAAGFDPDLLAQAIAFHVSHETSWPRSMTMPDGRYVGTVSIGDRPEHAAVLGPVRPRGGPNGLIVRHGRTVAEWGDTRRPDMTFSISKSYLALLVGIARADGLISDLDEPIGASVQESWFASPHNAAITWRHLLQLTSEWSGTLWDKPDSADHHRVVGDAAADAGRKGEPRTLHAPGTHFEYNDVRVNLLAACLTHRFARPLPEVLKARIMDPLGASPDWQWHGYGNATLDIRGQPVPVVSGGAHWGGGLFIGSLDHARVGALMLNDGVWDGRELLPHGWVRELTAPSPRNAQYGMLWWLNGSAAKRYPSAPADSYFALGAGTSLIWVAPSLDLVAVLRWIEGIHVDEMLGRIMAAVRR